MKPVFLGGRVLDSDYRGYSYSVIFTNFFSWSVNIEKGDRIAQVMFKREEVEFEEVDEFDDATVRDTKDFGSTGLKTVSY